VFSFFKNLLSPKTTQADAPLEPVRGDAPEAIEVSGMPPFILTQHYINHYGLPILDWPTVASWVNEISDSELQQKAWSQCEQAWLLSMQKALGNNYRLFESAQAVIVSSLEPKLAEVTLAYIERTLQRVMNALDGIATIPPLGKDILIVFDDDEQYYKYVSYYYPEEGGEFASSGGMYLNLGCSHFVTIKSDLRVIEPVIAHELAHSCVSHLPLPLWLDEGIAVNIEQQLVGKGSPEFTDREMHDMHTHFWNKSTIQEFWSGDSFARVDDGCLLSYDLARLMVKHMSADWDSFKKFVLAANYADAGKAAENEYLELGLGEAVCAFIGKDFTQQWSPDPSSLVIQN